MIKIKNKTNLLLILCINIISVITFQSNSQMTYAKNNNSNYCNQIEIQKALQNNDLNRALKLTNICIESNPMQVNMYNNRGIIYKNLGKYDEALKDFDYAINIDNNYKQAYYNRANLLLQLGYNDEALAELNRLVKIDPRDAFAYNTIGVILISQHKYKESIRYYDKVLSLDKSLTAVYYNRAYANYKLNNFDACISDYTKLLNSKVKLSDFEKAQAYHFRSSCNSQSHKAVSAVNDLSNAARLYKKIGETEYYNGIIEILKDAGYDTSEL